MKNLIDEDREALLQLVNVDQHVNLFFIGNIRNYGMLSDTVEYFGRYTKDGLVSSMMLYREFSITICSEEITQSDITFIRDIIEQKKIKHINCGTKSFELVYPYLKDIIIKSEKSNLCVYYPKNTELITIDTSKVRIATPNESYKIIKFFDEYAHSEESLSEEIKDESILIYLVEENDEIVSVTQATAFTDKAAMIIGVGTKESERKKGYASGCVKKLCDDLLQKGIRAQLFYTNPKAGSIYHKLGFENVSEYYLIEIKQEAR